MLSLIEQYRRCPTVENAKIIQEYFKRNPSRMWVLRDEFLRVLVAAGVRVLKHAA